jgi:DNA-binding response OmpR family regulator
MTLLALLLSTDDSASQVLGRALPACGIAVERFSDLAVATDRLRQQRFDAIVIDYDNAPMATEIYQESRRLNSGTPPVTVALLSEPAQTREIMSSGAHFVLYKPLTEEKAKAGLRALTALLNRERRRARRIPVQAPVDLTLPDGRKTDGILLDLSEMGMDVLTAETQVPGTELNFYFQLPDGSLVIQSRGQVAWAKENGQSGVRFLDLDEDLKTTLQLWLQSAALVNRPGAEETVPHCKLTDLSLGGCYVETDSPFPEGALIDLCLSAEEMAVHTEGMVRVAHPGCGMGVEFPSRTAEQRAQVANLIDFLRSCPESMLEMTISPRALAADITQFESDPAEPNDPENPRLEDPLLDLLRQGTSMERGEFLKDLHRQRSGESVTAEA